MKMNSLDKQDLFSVHYYIVKLTNDSFEGWSEDSKRGYLTACISIDEHIKKIDKW